MRYPARTLHRHRQYKAAYWLHCGLAKLQECKTIQAKIKSRSTRSPRKGRPTRAEAARRHEALLECALDTFLEHGFEQTTVLEIASALGMSKRTIYAYYADKETLFKAAVQRSIERYTIPLETLQALETDNLEATLAAVARLRIANVATPTGIKLNRILSAQSFRFPELFNTAFEVGTGPTVAFLSKLFSSLNARGDAAISDPKRAAVAFLSLVVGGPARMLVAGGHLNEEEIESRVRFSVQLFLNGIRPRA